MDIILNEYDWAERAIKNRDLGKHPARTLGIVAKYYLHVGRNKRDLRKLLENFYMQCFPDSGVKDMQRYVDNALDQAKRYPLCVIESIVITDAELEKINGLESAQLRKLAFTLLCVSKYRVLSGRCDNYRVTLKDSDIMRMANINTSIRRQSLLFGQLIRLGYIKPSKLVDDLSTSVLFISDGEPTLRISDFRNLGYQYQKFRGDPYFECARCGLTTKVKNPGVGRPPKYCSQCATEMVLQQRVNAVMRHRAEHKAEAS